MASKFFRMCACFTVAVMAATVVLAADTEKKKNEKPKKVSVLLREANKMINEAQEAYVNGESQKAIELYRKTLKEIERVEMENQDRVGTSEFAPVKFRKSLCETEIDRIILEEANANARTLSVTDTTELEKKRLERKRAAQTNNVPDKAVSLVAKKSDGTIVEKRQETKKEPAANTEKSATDSEPPKVDIAAAISFARDMMAVEHFDDAKASLLKVLRNAPEHREGRLLMAALQIRTGDPQDAVVVLDDLLEDFPNDESALLMAAGANFAIAGYTKAMSLLDRAMKVNPKRPDGYFNMAWLLLEMNPQDLDQPEMYYRQSVKLGGSRDQELEKRLGIKKN
ncbi:MAG: tetratricopeptide repeat protein [Kiritimatiellae bacterium]|nr:tetratricopeptide repeat protein [Kiritimatiellia bacterium]